MTGFNRWGATWCGANANLLTGYLRGELGMRGMCITDFSGSSQYMDLVDGLIAGSDIWDSPMPKIHTTKAANYENDAYIVTQMRNAMHHILYTVVNSNAMNGWSSTDTLKTVTPWWQTAIYALIAVMAVLTILCAWQLSKAQEEHGRYRSRSGPEVIPRRVPQLLRTNGSLSPKTAGRLPFSVRKRRHRKWVNKPQRRRA